MPNPSAGPPLFPCESHAGHEPRAWPFGHFWVSDSNKPIEDAAEGWREYMASLIFDTPRLLLRPVTAQDAAFILELMNEPPYIENIGDRGVRTIPDAKRYVAEKYTASYESRGHGMSLVELKEGSTQVGICGLVKREILDHPDVGFAFLQRHWSKGYASEAAAATLGFARDTLGLPYIYGVVSPKNPRSIRLLARLGLQFLRAQEFPGNAAESHVYGMALRQP
jgi:ribosomal-protein-alanine N-acetyltransferase